MLGDMIQKCWLNDPRMRPSFAPGHGKANGLGFLGVFVSSRVWCLVNTRATHANTHASTRAHTHANRRLRVENVLNFMAPQICGAINRSKSSRIAQKKARNVHQCLREIGRFRAPHPQFHFLKSSILVVSGALPRCRIGRFEQILARLNGVLLPEEFPDFSSGEYADMMH